MSKLKYVHATGSAILPMLTLTDYTLTSINDLMFKHHLAPMTGEISDAIRGLASRADIAFAPISNNGTYGLQNVVQCYGFSRCKDNARVKSTDALLVELNKLIKYGMFNLN